METTLTLRLDSKTAKSLDRLAARTGKSKSALAREALQRQLAVATFRALRRRALPGAAAAGFVTDEDVFRAVS